MAMGTILIFMDGLLFCILREYGFIDTLKQWGLTPF